ncbi:hypothetical protein M527_22880 [Sphingobium indicum IP26]|uniref:Uncharacterized protein n=1 Tax=Sphingobium indicum F2 TaxID=1450518 RepID=A0A8E0WRP0_9SPHN|nr:hypothetical protein M527_22880 [Sphingobium indicum IP26]KER36176.1 hypothetical protein AL00_11655 [Sphingobium indicum F2]KER36811.1 hypothetical protein AL00_08780 [Sphingobium indicum F2]
MISRICFGSKGLIAARPAPIDAAIPTADAYVAMLASVAVETLATVTLPAMPAGAARAAAAPMPVATRETAPAMTATVRRVLDTPRSYDVGGIKRHLRFDPAWVIAMPAQELAAGPYADAVKPFIASENDNIPDKHGGRRDALQQAIQKSGKVCKAGLFESLAGAQRRTKIRDRWRCVTQSPKMKAGHMDTGGASSPVKRLAAILGHRCGGSGGALN